MHLLVLKIKAEAYLTSHKINNSDQTANNHDVMEASDDTDMMEAMRVSHVCHFI